MATSHLIRADARFIPLADESVQCCITSPPYYGLRSYQGASDLIWGGQEDCAHEWGNSFPGCNRGGSGTFNGRNGRGEDYGRDAERGSLCQLCGAWRGHLGLEPTLELYVQHIVKVFREVRRVLHPTGTAWINLGDSYCSAGHGKSNFGYGTTGLAGGIAQEHHSLKWDKAQEGLKNKDLMMIPARVALALQADGWWLRSDIVWSKPNPMPESVEDRVTRSHEYIFLLSKSEQYFYDSYAIREQPTGNTHSRGPQRAVGALPKLAANGSGIRNNESFRSSTWGPVTCRNKRSVWEIATEPTPEAHFATFPQKLIEPCILAGSSEKGCCAECGAPWVRVTERERLRDVSGAWAKPTEPRRCGSEGISHMRFETRCRTLNWVPSCSHEAPVVPCLVLDPFGGSGTTSMVCNRLGRRSVCLELSPDYIEIAKRRTAQMGLGI